MGPEQQGMRAELRDCTTARIQRSETHSKGTKAVAEAALHSQNLCDKRMPPDREQFRYESREVVPEAGSRCIRGYWGIGGSGGSAGSGVQRDACELVGWGCTYMCFRCHCVNSA